MSDAEAGAVLLSGEFTSSRRDRIRHVFCSFFGVEGPASHGRCRHIRSIFAIHSTILATGRLALWPWCSAGLVQSSTLAHQILPFSYGRLKGMDLSPRLTPMMKIISGMYQEYASGIFIYPVLSSPRNMRIMFPPTTSLRRQQSLSCLSCFVFRSGFDQFG